MTPGEPISLAVLVTAILEDLGIRYVIGGSVASSLIGEPRSTLDLDVMIEIDEPQLRSLLKRLGPDFYVDEESVFDALRSRSSFSAIQYATSMKVDFFLAEDAPFARRQMDRRRAVHVDPGRTMYFYTPEDLIVRKLLWFRAGGEVSDRQWRDVLGILKALRSGIDLKYLRDAAEEVEVADLLRRALSNAS